MPPGPHLPGIDALRGLAVLLVWCHHLQAYSGIELPLVGRIGGLIGVQLFFVISGYLIVRSAQRESLGSYALRRALRIFPCYWTVVIAVTLLSPRVSLEMVRAEPLAFAVNLLALSHWWPPALQMFDVTTVSWTLSIELGWYLLAPLLAWWLRPGRADGGRWLALGAGALLLSSAWVLAAQAGRLDRLFAAGIAAAGVSPVNDFMRFAYIVNATPAHLVFFAAGALLLRYEIPLRRVPALLLGAAFLATVPTVERWNAALGLHPSFVSGIGLAALFLLGIRGDGRSAGTGGQAAAGQRALAGARAAAGRITQGVPAGPWRAAQGLLAALGRISYPVYLVHVPVLLAALALARDRFPAGAWVAAALALPATLLLSALLHRLVERPGIALGRRLSR